MALQMYIGCSGSGKSHRLYEHIIEESIRHPELTYLILVPEQYNLSTQQGLISMHPKNGILNIDVLSFSRLAHRVFEEVGYKSAKGATIDDIGKNLIIRHMAGRNEGRLNALSGLIDRLGYISEVKSVISEFMQYGVGKKQLDDLIEKSKDRGILKAKLIDLKLLYDEFLKYINEKYVTTEEILQKVRDAVPRSEKLKKSVIVLDGYTGFTPVQLDLIGELLKNTVDMYVTLLMDPREEAGEDEGNSCDEHELFYLSKKTLSSLEKICLKEGIERKKDVVISDDIPARYVYNGSSRELIHLEKNLFRVKSSVCKYEGEHSIHIYSGTDPLEEAVETAVRIKRLIETGDYRYKDIAVVSGDMGTYMNACARAFERYDIPFFVDKTRPVLLNPMIEYIRAVIEIMTGNYSYESVFRFLRSAVSGYDPAGVDLLENYVLKYGIKGRKAWKEPFVIKPKDMEDESFTLLNELRASFVLALEPFEAGLFKGDKDAGSLINVRVICEALYRFLSSNKLQDKMDKLSEKLEREGDAIRAGEYGRIYEEVCDLLDKMVRLMPDEEITLKEYEKLLDAGFDEIRTGVIPGSSDYVQVGDILRTRLRDIKALFFVGVNDGIIPSSQGGGGIISDMEREFLADNDLGIELAPTLRMQGYTQRLYLYMLMSKPSNHLYVSYAKLSDDGNSLNPSYLIRQLMRMFPNIKAEQADDGIINRVYNPATGCDELALRIPDAIGMGLSVKEREDFLALLSFLASDDSGKDKVKGLIDPALQGSIYKPKDSISKAVARAIYGSDLVCSVTRLENYARCAYSHFLKYGLSLKERELFSFEASDMGSIFHDTLKTYADILKERKKEWTALEDEEREKTIEEAIERCIAREDYGAVYGSFRTRYTINRMKRIMGRTVNTLTDQLKKGKFTPYDFEFSFSSLNDLKSLNLNLSDDEKMHLLGRIDRMDVCREAGNVYVKIIDYKSGNKSFDLAAIYLGLDLQLAVYLNAGMELIAGKEGGPVIPAGMFYYHIDDPIIKCATKEDEEAVPDEISKSLKMAGLVNADNDIYRLIDADFAAESTVIPVGIKKDGDFTKASSVATGDDFKTIENYVNHKMVEMGREIFDGNIKANPLRNAMSDTLPCEYCEFFGICDYRGDGVSGRESVDNDDIITAMNDALGEKA